MSTDDKHYLFDQLASYEGRLQLRAELVEKLKSGNGSREQVNGWRACLTAIRDAANECGAKDLADKLEAAKERLERVEQQRIQIAGGVGLRASEAVIPPMKKEDS